MDFGTVVIMAVVFGVGSLLGLTEATKEPAVALGAPAVDGGDKLNAGDTAVESGGKCDHIRCYHPYMRAKHGGCYHVHMRTMS